MERRERSKDEMYVEGRVRLWLSIRWITINCVVFSQLAGLVRLIWFRWR